MTKVKICGITNLKDAEMAVEAGADLLGFIFYEPSPRYVSPEEVKKIVSSFGFPVSDSDNLTLENLNSKPLFVGVFVNSPLAEVEQILDFCNLNAAQFHGEESPEFLVHFKGRSYKALRPKSREEVETAIENYQLSIINDQSPNLPACLLDAYHPTLYGGTGHVTDWSMAANIARQYSIMLAGSLTPDNVAEAIDAVCPWGVDVSSGVEKEKGKKDHKKIREFIKTAKRVG